MTAPDAMMPNWWVDKHAKHKPEGHTCGRCGIRVMESYSFHADLPGDRFCSRGCCSRELKYLRLSEKAAKRATR